MEPFENDIPFTIAFSRIDRIGPITFRRFIEVFGTAEAAWNAAPQDLLACGVKRTAVDALLASRAVLIPDEEYQFVLKCGIHVLLWCDPRYPPLLAQSYAAPFILYYRGTLPDSTDPTIAVVGTREASRYGLTVTQSLTRDLVQRGFTIVSGLALGIDTVAHAEAVNAGGKTIAVLGSSVDADTLYPAINKLLAERIISHGGCLLSEYAPLTECQKHYFPLRNRIIAGLSLGTLVIEAPERSGALITAQYALQENREVLAVPGAITNLNAAGTNELIKRGAHVVTSAQDVVDVFSFTPAESAVT